MSKYIVHLFIGIAALALGLFAIPLQSFQEIITKKSEQCRDILHSSLFKRSTVPIVVDSTRKIKYIGSLSPSSTEQFKNIFYGQDTSGNNRFAPPIPIQNPRGSIIDATQDGAWCPQGTGDIFPFTSPVKNISENCLSLSITRPTGTTVNSKLPVIVWIHGGGHALGSGSDILYNPDGLIKQAATEGNPLIFVSINYRLGIFGFATSEALVKSHQTNVGLRDQRAALEWVRDNIESFGGDAQKVTAIGQSVGASDIGIHLTSFGGTHGVPFQQAIMMSGSPGLNFNTMSDLVKNNTADVALKLGCVKNNDPQSFDTLRCLRDAPIGAITNLSVDAARTSRPPFGEAFFYPTYDNDTLPGRPSQLIRAGKIVRGIPIIVSWVTNEGAWYPPTTTSTDEDVLNTFGLWLFNLSTSTKARLLELYPLAEFESMVRPDYDGLISPQYYRAAQINKDIWFTCPIIDFAWQYIRVSGLGPSKVWMYEHNATRFTPVFENIGVPMWRVSHLSDIPYVLNNRQLRGGADNSDVQLALSDLISRSIAKFVTQGRQSDDWHPAFGYANDIELNQEYPKELSLNLFGGPYESKNVKIRERPQNRKGIPEYAIGAERLLKRCEFINSEKVRGEISI